jgi:hypothetical protein
MSKKTRRRLDATLKAKVALEALRNEATVAALVAKYQLTPTRSTPGRSSCSTARLRFSPAGPARRRAGRLRLASSTPRSASWRWSGIFYHGGPGADPGRARRDDRTRRTDLSIYRYGGNVRCSDWRALGSIASWRRRIPKTLRTHSYGPATRIHRSGRSAPTIGIVGVIGYRKPPTVPMADDVAGSAVAGVRI